MIISRAKALLDPVKRIDEEILEIATPLDSEPEAPARTCVVERM